MANWGNRRRMQPRPHARPAVATGARPQVRLAMAAGLAMAVFMGLAAFRETVVRAAPPMASAYAALGMRVNLVGLDFANVAARVAQDGGRRVLAVEGEIANPGGSQRVVPPVRLVLRAADGGALYSWSVKPTKAALNGGERVAFGARLAAPPADAFDAVLEFDSDSPPASAIELL